MMMRTGAHLESLKSPVMMMIMKMMILSIFSHLKNKPRRSCKLGFYAAENQNNLNYSSSFTSSSREEQEEKETTKGRGFTGFCAE